MADNNISRTYFPGPIDSLIASMKKHSGPSSYTVITAAVPPTGGDTVQAAELELKNVVAVIPIGLSDNGQYYVEAVFTTPGFRQSIQLMWKTASTGAEVAGATDLSARTVTLLAFGT